MTCAVIAEFDQENLKASTLNTVTAACQLSDTVDVLLVGADCQKAAKSAATIQGIREVVCIESPSLVHGLAEVVVKALVPLVKDYETVLIPATTFGKNILPRLADKLDVQPITDVVEVVAHDTFVRPIYAGNAIATVQSLDSKKVITVRSTGFDAVATDGNAEVVKLDLVTDAGNSSHVSDELTESERPDLGAASVIISGGRGMQNGDNFKLLEGIADKLGAAIGASRAAVDAGFVPNDMQVGQTGKIVAPDLYIAVGISGAIQHLAGMKDSKIIVAINKDPEAPIFQVADYGIVADLFDALPELESKL